MFPFFGLAKISLIRREPKYVEEIDRGSEHREFRLISIELHLKSERSSVAVLVANTVLSIAMKVL